MDEAPLAPYYLPLQFQPLAAYLTRGHRPQRWAEDQFALEVVAGHDPGPLGSSRGSAVLGALDSLPLQVKDLVRGLIDQLRLDPDRSFLPGTLATWCDGVMRVNVDWEDLEPVARLPGAAGRRRRLLKSTLVHECGHALVEDRRGGVTLRQYLRLLAASGWLPHPDRDPTPFRGAPLSLDQLEAHFLARLTGQEPGWDPESAVDDPGQPGVAALDRQLVRSAAAGRPGPGSGGIGLMPASKLALALLAAPPDPASPAGWRRSGLSTQEVRSAVRAYPSVSPYAEEEPAEALAEVFRCLQLEQPEPRLPALEEGRRVLVRPWREAELRLGPRSPAPAPPPSRLPAPLRSGR